jgi:hypothetical protein
MQQGTAVAREDLRRQLQVATFPDALPSWRACNELTGSACASTGEAASTSRPCPPSAQDAQEAATGAAGASAKAGLVVDCEAPGGSLDPARPGRLMLWHKGNMRSSDGRSSTPFLYVCLAARLLMAAVLLMHVWWCIPSVPVAMHNMFGPQLLPPRQYTSRWPVIYATGDKDGSDLQNYEPDSPLGWVGVLPMGIILSLWLCGVVAMCGALALAVVCESLVPDLGAAQWSQQWQPLQGSATWFVLEITAGTWRLQRSEWRERWARPFARTLSGQVGGFLGAQVRMRYLTCYLDLMCYRADTFRCVAAGLVCDDRCTFMAHLICTWLVCTRHARTSRLKDLGVMQHHVCSASRTRYASDTLGMVHAGPPHRQCEHRHHAGDSDGV